MKPVFDKAGEEQLQEPEREPKGFGAFRIHFAPVILCLLPDSLWVGQGRTPTLKVPVPSVSELCQVLVHLSSTVDCQNVETQLGPSPNVYLVF